MANKLILRKQKSPYTGNFADTTKSKTLSISELDNNQIYLKGLNIITGSTSGTDIILDKLNGDQIIIDASSVSNEVNLGNTDLTLTENRTINLTGNSLTYSDSVGSTSVESSFSLSSGDTLTFSSPFGGAVYSKDDESVSYTGGGIGGTFVFNVGRGTAQMDVTPSTGTVGGFTLGDDNILTKGFVTHQTKGVIDDSKLPENNLYYLYVDSGELKGRYKDNLGVVTDLTIGSIQGGLISVNDSSGVPTYYSDMQTAVTAAGAGGTIHLHSDITQSTTITLPSGTGIDFTINGNGYTITHTSDTGSEYQLFLAGGTTQTLYLNNIKIVSNGTSSAPYSSSVFGYSPAITNVICSSDTYIYALNNNIKDFGTIRGGILEAVNGYVNFSSTVYDSTVITKSSSGGFRNCSITVNSGGGIGGNLIGCHIVGDCLTHDLITTSSNSIIWDCTIEVTDSSGNNNAIQTSSATWNGLPNLQNVKVYYKGSGNLAVNLVYIASIKDVYVYAENGQTLYAQNATQTGGYNMENVVLETNSTNDEAFYRLDSGDFKMKNVTATCLNASNTKSAYNIRVTSPRVLTMENCTANVNNASVKHVALNGTGSAYIYNLTMSAIGTGLDMGAVTLLNANIPDAYGNIQIG